MFKKKKLKIKTSNLVFKDNELLNLNKTYIWNNKLNISSPTNTNEYIIMLKKFNNSLMIKNINSPVIRHNFFSKLRKYKSIFIKNNYVYKITDIIKILFTKINNSNIKFNNIILDFSNYMLKVLINSVDSVNIIIKNNNILGDNIIKVKNCEMRIIYDNFIISPRLIIYSKLKLINGYTFRDIINNKKKKISKLFYLLLIYQGLNILKYLNINNLFHNDIKSDNFMIQYTNNDIKLLNKEYIINNTNNKFTDINKKYKYILFTLIDLEYSSFENNLSNMFPYDCFCFLDIFNKNKHFKKLFPDLKDKINELLIKLLSINNYKIIRRTDIHYINHQNYITSKQYYVEIDNLLKYIKNKIQLAGFNFKTI